LSYHAASSRHAPVKHSVNGLGAVLPMFSNLSISQKLYAGFGVVLLILLLLT